MYRSDTPNLLGRNRSHFLHCASEPPRPLSAMTALVGVGCEALVRCITVRSLRALTKQVDCSFLSRGLYYASLRCIYLFNLQRSNTVLYFKPPLIEHTAIPGLSLILLSLASRL